ncbi:MAG: hypothetical protein ACAF41_22610 [Leptolyngbya sp. BL-A-14]
MFDSPRSISPNVPQTKQKATIPQYLPPKMLQNCPLQEARSHNLD